jgi:capsular polysaccharide export protein
MLLYPVWYDPCRDRLCRFEDALSQIEAQARAWREDRNGWNAQNIRLWKRAHFQRFFGKHKAVWFETGSGGSVMHWGRPEQPLSDVAVVEDGFLRSRGLGAELVPPMSLVLDNRGIYFDPTRPSRLEELISQRASLRKGQALRAEALMRALTELRISKYNLSGDMPNLPDGHRILVPGQVEDDASVRYGCDEVQSNLALLQATRAANPDAVIVYKPHPDVEAGLRAGAVSDGELNGLADVVVANADIAALLDQVQEVWTMTSLTGFEALMRGVRVTCLGTPFYAGWGLTRDLGKVPARRGARPTLEGLVHATLIDYPRYLDPVSGLSCPVEVIVDRLASGESGWRSGSLRVLSKLQGVFASYAGLWR